jgi:hypothetical protein
MKSRAEQQKKGELLDFMKAMIITATVVVVVVVVVACSANDLSRSSPSTRRSLVTTRRKASPKDKLKKEFKAVQFDTGLKMSMVLVSDCFMIIKAF